MKFPVRIKHRKQEAVIYGKTAAYPFYRLCYHVAGRRITKSLSSYAEARQEAETKLRELADGSHAPALSKREATDALAALQRLAAFRQATGRAVSILAAVSEYAEAAGKLQGHTLGEAVEGYLRTAVGVKRQNIAEAVEEFLQLDAPRTHASEGQRAQLSAKYAYNRERQLRRFAATFPNPAVCDLSKEHLDTFMGGLEKVRSTSRNGRAASSAKSRNHYRATVRQFLHWAIRKDYLAPSAPTLRKSASAHRANLRPCWRLRTPPCSPCSPSAACGRTAHGGVAPLGLGGRMASARPHRDHGGQSEDTPASPGGNLPRLGRVA
jgi:hypothetical protein